MIAKYKGRCSHCGKDIAVGDAISWSRQERGKVYHLACKPSPSSPAERESEKILAVLSELLKTKSVPDFTSTVPASVDTVASTVVSTVKTKLCRNAAWYEELAAVLPISNRILLVGPPSTGKSTTAMLLARTKYRVTMTETTSREDLIGMFHLVDGATRWVDGPFTTAMRLGQSVLVDEIDRYSPECASLLYSLIDDKPHISLPNGDFVEAKDGYRVLMTTNESIETLPVAVQDRIEVIIMAITPHPDALSGIDKVSQGVVMRYYQGQAKKTFHLFPTVRRMRVFHRLMSAGIPNDIAANLVFGTEGACEVLSSLTSAESNED